MNLNYAILRVEPIKTIPDLAQIGSHNKRYTNFFKIPTFMIFPLCYKEI